MNGSSAAAEIEKTLTTLLKAFAKRDASILRDVYTDDADWINAFGTSRRGRDEIVEYLKGLFADEHFDAGSLTGRPEVDVRPLGDEAVIVRVATVIKGQQTIDGSTLPDRHNHSLKVLQRQADGRYLIVSEMYMDARTETTYSAE